MIDPSQFAYLSPGPHRIKCTACNGGQSGEVTMHVNKAKDGNIYWKCYRNSCGEQGRTFSAAGATAGGELDDRKPRPFTAPIYPLQDLQVDYFKLHYDIEHPDAYTSDDPNRVLLPIRQYDGRIRGYNYRRWWHISSQEDASPKTLAYFNQVDDPLLAWYHPLRCDRQARVIIVEDMLSAMRYAEHLEGVAVALLGTGVNEGKIAEIQRHTASITIALDKDATGQAFAMARKWGQAFLSCRVLILDEDIKDMPLDKLKSLVI